MRTSARGPPPFTGKPPSLQGHTSGPPTFPETGWEQKGWQLAAAAGLAARCSPQLLL